MNIYDVNTNGNIVLNGPGAHQLMSPGLDWPEMRAFQKVLVDLMVLMAKACKEINSNVITITVLGNKA